MGSLIFFFFLRCSATQALRLKISQQHNANFTNSHFIQDLPYIQNAFVETIVDLRESIYRQSEELTDEITMIAQQLCEPDPRRRGDPGVLSAAHIAPYDIQPYISKFDRLARTAERKIM